ncbi:MAG: TRIC cation channel family protein [Candidatus Eremiobacteraeota bacterium]|nr:TRIC cation channel family protein [Candidatus Eremiobacteraeota bacterium]MBV8366089.1 TRIC cation channel family protein [Candidatus Eremiobacteraeota bacterium]
MTMQILSIGLVTLGTMGIIDLIAATTNAFNGALLARRPDHYRNFTVMGIIIMAYFGGIGGGVLRDVLVSKVPSPLVNPWYLILCFAAAALALLIEYNATAKFKDGLFQFMTAFSLPWYAIVGAQTAVDAKLGYVAAIIIGVIGTTGGRYLIDVTCNVIPKQFVRGEFFVLTAAMTAGLYLVLHFSLGWDQTLATAGAFLFGFGFRLTAQALGWEEWEPWEPAGVKTSEKTREKLGEGLHAEFERDK